MNMSKAISQLKMQLGLYAITLPFKDEITGNTIPTENVIREVLTTMTIPVYSQFCPWQREGSINITDMKCINQQESIYLLPTYLTMTPIIDIISIQLPQYNSRGTFGDIAPAYGINRSVEGVATSQAYMMLAGQMRAEPTWEYLGQNKVKLYGFPKTMISIKVACEHEPNGESIKDSCYDSFMELATLDMKIFLYNNLKMYDEIPTAFGNIKLHIEDYNSAEGDRNQLLDRWRDTFHVDMDYSIFM